MTEYHAEILRDLQQKTAGTGWQIPSQAFIQSGAQIVDYMNMRSLLCEFPSPQAQTEFDGALNFGWIGVMVDHTASLLAFLTSGSPCVPVSQTVTYIRPMGVMHGPVVVEAKLRNRSRSLVFAEAKVTSGQDRTVATATVTYTVGPYPRDA